MIATAPTMGSSGPGAKINQFFRNQVARPVSNAARGVRKFVSGGKGSRRNNYLTGNSQYLETLRSKVSPGYAVPISIFAALLVTTLKDLFSCQHEWNLSDIKRATNKVLSTDLIALARQKLIGLGIDGTALALVLSSWLKLGPIGSSIVTPIVGLSYIVYRALAGLFKKSAVTVPVTAQDDGGGKDSSINKEPPSSPPPESQAPPPPTNSNQQAEQDKSNQNTPENGGPNGAGNIQPSGTGGLTSGGQTPSGGAGSQLPGAYSGAGQPPNGGFQSGNGFPPGGLTINVSPIIKAVGNTGQ